MEKSIKVNFLYNVLLNVSKVIFPLVTAPYVARVLKPDGVGLYNFTTTYVNYFALFALLGVPTYGVREIAKIRGDIEHRNRFVSEIISIEFYLTLLVTCVFLTTLFLVPKLNNNIIIFLVAGVSLYTSPFTIDWYYKGMENFKFITERSLIIKLLSVISLFVFVKEKSDLINYILIYSLANVANEVWNFIVLYKSELHPHLTIHGLMQHIKPLLVLFMSSIAISIYLTLDTLMLGFMSDYKEVGYYNNATQVTRSLLMAISSLAIVAMPRISYYMKQGKQDEINNLIKKSVSIISFLAFPATIAIILISPTFVPLFFGKSFAGAVIPMQILSLLMIATGFNNLTGTQILLSLGKDRCFLFSVLSGTIINFTLNLVLIPLWGAVGTSVASVFAEFMVLLTSLIFVKRNTNVRIKEWSDTLKTIISVMGIYLGYWIAHYICQGWIEIGLFTVLGSALYFLIQFFLKNSIVLYTLQLIMKKIKK